jgi:hypothetical protein
LKYFRVRWFKCYNERRRTDAVGRKQSCEEWLDGKGEEEKGRMEEQMEGVLKSDEHRNKTERERERKKQHTREGTTGLAQR